MTYCYSIAIAGNRAHAQRHGVVTGCRRFLAKSHSVTTTCSCTTTNSNGVMRVGISTGTNSNYIVAVTISAGTHGNSATISGCCLITDSDSAVSVNIRISCRNLSPITNNHGAGAGSAYRIANNYRSFSTIISIITYGYAVYAGSSFNTAVGNNATTLSIFKRCHLSLQSCKILVTHLSKGLTCTHKAHAANSHNGQGNLCLFSSTHQNFFLQYTYLLQKSALRHHSPMKCTSFQLIQCLIRLIIRRLSPPVKKNVLYINYS